MEIRRFNEEDAEEISNLICRNFKEVNIRDYSLDEIERLVSVFTPEYIKQRAKKVICMLHAKKKGLLVLPRLVTTMGVKQKQSSLVSLFYQSFKIKE